MIQIQTLKAAVGSKSLSRVLLLAALVVAMLLAGAGPAHADTIFTVNSTGDREDANPGNGICSAGFISGPNGGFVRECTLRAAIQEANATAGADSIHFNIPDSFPVGVTLKPASALPVITEQVAIDGYSQPGASLNTLAVGNNAVLTVELEGPSLQSANGLTLRANNSLIRGLVINHFDGAGIHISGNANKVEGSFIGTDPSGQQDVGNVDSGVFIGVGASENVIGGTSPDKRNLISANGSGTSGAGILIEGAQTTNNKIEGNYIGTTRDGTSPLGNTRGVFINVGASNNTVGGTAPGVANTIAFNKLDGVVINNSAGANAVSNRILSNSIFSNADLGMDLNPGGRTLNDPDDSDTGANNLQNFPVLTSASNLGGLTSITGTLDSLPNKTFKIQLFSNSSGEEGKRPLGERSVATDGSGDASFTFTPAEAVPVGENITATATSPTGDTSEFSGPLAVTLASTTFTVDSTGDENDADIADSACDVNPLPDVSQCTLRAAVQEANDTLGANEIEFDIPDSFGEGVKTIEPNFNLPIITDEVTIDGYTQRPCSINPEPCSKANDLTKGTNAVLMIELSGAKAQGASGLIIDASNVVVRGLVINGFNQQGIAINSGAGNRIEGNFIGTDPSGIEDLGNSLDGVLIASASNTTVGGTTPEARNLISGNQSSGVFIGGSATTTRVEGNYIGTKASGSGDLGNTFEGVRIAFGASKNSVGGASAGAANTIAFNGTAGVLVIDDSTGNRILRNAIFSNDGPGIRLFGETENDPLDPDTGPNNLQNFPIVRSAVTSGGSTTIEVRLNSVPSKTFVVRFFSNPPAGDEGKRFIGQKSVTTNANGNVAFSFTPAQVVVVGQTITTTATSASGDTSQFSAPRALTAA